MSSKTSKVLIFIMTTMFVFVNTSQARFLLIELDGNYENKDIRPITGRPIGNGPMTPASPTPLPSGTEREFTSRHGIPAFMETTVDDTNKDASSEPERSDEAPVSIEESENIEVNIDDDDLQKARTHNMEGDSKGLRILAGKVIMIYFVELF